MKNIILNLTNSLSANNFSEGERIHYKAFEKVIHLIEQQKDKYKDYNPSDDEEDGTFMRCYNAISVFGERGIGKTSFLMSLRNHLKCSKNTVGERNYEDMYILPMIDPTLIEEKGHIFLLIISLLDNVVNECLENESYQGDVDTNQRKWNITKSLLAKGLPSLKLDGLTYHEPQWNEDEYVMNRGMESVKAAFDLERNFHKLVHIALEILGKKSFVLIFDDIDVDFKRGWDLLETVRKFLTTPQLILIISGNLKLFSKNIRKQQWHNLGKELLINEKNKTGAQDYYLQLVNEIEGQYLLKILNSENRVYLYDVGRNIQMNGDRYIVVLDEEKENKTLDEIYKDILQSFGILGSSTIRMFIDFMESTSVRTQIHFLYNAIQMHGRQDENNFMSAISAFSSRIYAQNVSVDLATNEDMYCSVLLHYLIEDHLVEDAYQLLPRFENTDINSVMSAFSFLFAMLSKENVSIIFDYWVKICTARNNMRFLVYGGENVSNRLDTKVGSTINWFCKEVGMFQKRNLRSIIGNVMATTLSINGKQNMDATVRLLGLGGIAKANKDRIDNRIDIVLHEKKIEEVLGYLPLICLLHSNKNEREIYYSFNALIANIGQIIRSKRESDILIALKNASQPVSYQIKSELADGDNVNETFNAEFEISLDEDALSIISNAIYSWLKLYSKECAYAPYLFGRIATRFFFAQANILENSSNKIQGLGDLFSLMSMAFINAALIEEMLVKGPNIKGLNINNVSTSSKILINNIKYLRSQENWRNIIPFTSWLISCPLIYSFIKDDVVRDFVYDCIGGEKAADTLKLILGQVVMPNVLNSIGLYKTKKKMIDLSTAKDKINTCIRMINDKGINAQIIMDEKYRDEAISILSSIFKSVSSRRLSQLRNKCDLSSDGKLVLKVKP